jgi:vacuolar-type H+-ATPase catalytic subunit A/Vma1
MRLPSRRSRRTEPPAAELRRLAEKLDALAEATQKWVSVLRDMEGRGESGDPSYETYFDAYMQAKRQEKRVELEFFNLRQGLST